MTFEDGCTLLSPVSYGFEKFPEKCYAVSGEGDTSIKAYNCNQAHSTWCKKSYDVTKACTRGEEMRKCQGSNILTDDREETTASIQGISVDIPGEVFNRNYQFNVILTGATDEDANVYVGTPSLWYPCESVEKLAYKETFTCESMLGSLKFEGQRPVSEIKIMGCVD